MKKLLMLAALMAVANFAGAAYFTTIFQDQNYKNPQISAGATFNSRFQLNGGNSQVALVYHGADIHDTLLPQFLLDAGVQPISWSLLNAGAGVSNGSLSLPFGPSVNLVGTVLGPLLQFAKSSSSKVAQGAASMVQSPSGGITAGPVWTLSHLYANGTVFPVDSWTAPPGWFIGGLWKFTLGASK